MSADTDDEVTIWVGQLGGLLACGRRFSAARAPSHERSRPGARSPAPFRLRNALEHAINTAHARVDTDGASLDRAADQAPPTDLSVEERLQFREAIDAYAEAFGDSTATLIVRPDPVWAAPDRTGAFRLKGLCSLVFRRDDGSIEIRRLLLQRAPSSTGEPFIGDVALGALIRANLGNQPSVHIVSAALLGDIAVHESILTSRHFDDLRQRIDNALARSEERGDAPDGLAAPEPGWWCNACPEIRGCSAVPQHRSAALSIGPTPQRPKIPHDPTLGAPVRAAPGVLVLSPSKVREFTTCPRRFFLNHVLRLGHDGDERVFGPGTEVHEELRARHVDIDRHDDEHPVDPSSSGDRLVLTLARAHSTVCPREEAEYLGGEIELRWFLPGKALLLSGRVDALWRYPDGTVEARDYKTGHCPATLDNDLPAAMYALLTAAAHGEHEPRVRVVYESLSGEQARTIELTVNDDVLHDALARVVRIAEEIRFSTSFPARPSTGLCNSCDYGRLCPMSAVPK